MGPHGCPFIVYQQKHLYAEPCLVASCGSNGNCPSCVVNLLCIFPLLSFLSATMFIKLLVSARSEHLASHFPSSVNKSTPGTRYEAGGPGGGICETWDICILPFFILVSCLNVWNKMTALFTTRSLCVCLELYCNNSVNVKNYYQEKGFYYFQRSWPNSGSKYRPSVVWCTI